MFYIKIWSVFACDGVCHSIMVEGLCAPKRLNKLFDLVAFGSAFAFLKGRIGVVWKFIPMGSFQFAEHSLKRI